jgi:hypothetical protein
MIFAGERKKQVSRLRKIALTGDFSLLEMTESGPDHGSPANTKGAALGRAFTLILYFYYSNSI